MGRCAKCGQDTVVLVESRGHHEVLRCQNCGAEWAGTVYPARDISDLEFVGVRLCARWRGEAPSWAELKALREMFPALRDHGLGELAERLRGGEGFVSDQVSPMMADRLIGEAKARGLVLERTGEPPCIAVVPEDSKHTR